MHGCIEEGTTARLSLNPAMTIRNFIPAAMKNIAAMFHFNKAKMNQPATVSHHALISIPQTAAVTDDPVPAVPRRVAKQRPAKTNRVRLALSHDLMSVKLIQRVDGKLKKACFISRAGRSLVAKIVLIHGREVILRRNNQQFSRAIAA
jgi:hypothetical protein